MAEKDDSGHSSGESEQPIIIKKIKKGGHGHHGGAWKVAYADFVTAMMAFFIVMWILASSAEVKEAVSEYFNAPENFDIFTGVRTVPVSLFDDATSGSSDGEGGGQGEAAAAASGAEGATSGAGSGAEGTTSGQGSQGQDVGGFMSFHSEDGKAKDTTSVDSKTYQAIQDSIAARQMLEKTGKDIAQDVKELMGGAETAEMQTILSSIKIEITSEGIRIDLIESNDNNFFEIGSARLKPDAITVLRQLASRIGRLSNYVDIEGHTDSRKYSNNAVYGNWELSADRANSARKILEGSGMWSGQITSVSGHADSQLKNPANPFDISNRRVSILVKNLSRADLLVE